MSLVVAVDCSTTAAKAVVVDAAGTVRAQASRAFGTDQPHPAWHEQDAREWWTATSGAVADAVGQVDAREVAAVCLTHQRETFVCLDAAGEPLRPAILWVDGRAHAEIAALGTAEVHRLSGKPPDTTPAIYKLAWLARHESQVLADAAHVVDVHGYLTWRLTGRWATSTASADTLGLLDAATLTWAPELCALAGVRPEQLPELVGVGAQIGPLTADAAAALGLPGPVPLVAGTGDGQAAGLVLGATVPGVAYLNLGTSMVLGVHADGYVWDPAFRTLAGLRPGQYTLETVLNAAAYLADWARTRFGAGAGIAELEAAAAQVVPGAEGLLTLPYWNAAQTPYWDPVARGAIVGWHGRHTPAHLYRSVLEGVAFELRLHLERLEAATGRAVEDVRAVGGGARSELWVQVVSDVTGRPVRVCSAGEASAAGAAMLARAYLDGVPAGGTALDPPGTQVLPDAARAATYAPLYEAYSGLYPALRDTFAALAAAQPPQA